MIKKLTLLIFVIFVSLFGDKYYVKANQTDGDITGDGTSSKPWQHISFAINNTVVANTDSIYLFGTFNLNEDAGKVSTGITCGLNVRKSLTFIGEDPSKTIIQGDDVFNSNHITWRIFYIENGDKDSDGKIEDLQVTLKNITMKYGHGDPSGGIYALLETKGSSLTIENCIITENYYTDRDDFDNRIGGAGLSCIGGYLTVKNSLIKNNINTNTTSLYFQGRGGGGLFFEPRFDGVKCVIENSTIVNNEANQWGGGVWINALGTKFPNPIPTYGVEIINCTFSNNKTFDGKGSAIFVSHDINENFFSNLALMINSCTLADNGSANSYAIYNQLAPEYTGIELKNSIIKNYNVENNIKNLYPSTDSDPSTPDCYTLSYCVTDDETYPVNVGDNNFTNYKDPIIKEEISDEYGTSFYKVVEGSPAKDAIPRGDFSSYPYYNGAGVEYVTAEMDTTSIDQRGFFAWNKNKDIGAYESPYYWVDVTAQEIYETIPRWKTDLRIADQTEYNLAPEEEKWKWTDYMRAQTGGRIILTENSEIERFDKSELKWNNGSFMDVNGNSRVINGLDFASASTINVFDNAQLSLQLTNAKIPANASVMVGNNSSLIVENGTDLIFEDGVIVNLGEDAEIRVMNKGRLVTNNNTSENVTFKNTTGMWYSIIGEVGSMIEIAGTEFNGAEFGVCGAPSVCSITNSSFVGCENGISLVNCGDYTISGNSFSGKGTDTDGRGIGTGITLTSCSKPVIGNTIRNFAEGIKLVSSSVILAKNRIVNNINSGLYITGHGSKPILVNSVSKDLTPRLNNEIINNCLNNPLYNGAQIYMKYSAGAYMTGGYNNVFSGAIGSLPTVPCIKGIINISPEPVISKVTIASERNYWGYNNINAGNQYLFFDLPNSIPEERELIETGYFIDYDPYALNPYIREQSSSIDLSSNESRSNESILLFNAMKLEQLDNNTASIKIYEQIIKKYPETPEYFVAMTRLPELYIKEEMTLDPLLAVFDENIATGSSINRKFFKSLKITTHIKSKSYDTAIMLAEEMKTEAECEDEIMLAEIDIAVAKMMKDAENGVKGGISNNSDDLNELLSKLNGTDSKKEPAGISENVLPSEIKLYQNYPNPFNPVTQIKFDLAKTAKVRLSIYNVYGQLVSELTSGVMNAGKHAIDFNGSKLNSGIYYYMLEVDGKNITKKMVLTK